MRFLTLACLVAGLELGAAPILLKSGAIDGGAQPSAVTRASTATAAVNKYIIQHDGKIPAAWRESVVATGAKILHYIPENAYLISVTDEALAVLRAQVACAALVPYVAAYRVDPSITTAAKSPMTALSGSSAADSATTVADDTNTVTYTVSLFSEALRDAYVAAINALDSCRVVRADGAVIRADLTAAGVAAVSAFDEVEYVTIWVAPKLKNNVALQAARMNVETAWPNGASGLGLTGKGQVVAVADTGLDTGNTSTVHADVRGRISRAYALGRTNDWSDPDGHGTHVIGSVLGNGSCSSSPKIRGAAYEATLIVQSTIDAWGDLSGIPEDIRSLFSQAYATDGGKAGARIHSNSWGESTYGSYNTDAKNIDSFAFTHPDMLILFAASNDGVDSSPRDGVIDTDSLSGEATAKNGLTVGASENQRTSGGYSTETWGDCWSSDYPRDPIASDYLSRPYDGSHQGMAAFSSRGPCDDGRIKPDIVAPGTDILSMRSSRGETQWAEYNSYYQYSGGTSMATPLVAGTAALARQWLVEKRGITSPDAATIKALLLAGAQSLTPGQYGTGSYREIPASYPNNVEGWGQVNLGQSLVNARGVLVYDARVIQDEAVDTYTVSATAGSRLAIVLAYADAPASLSASKQLVNDLDLKVVSPSGTVYYPNSRKSADRYNNVEGVRLASAEAGVYTVTVTGYNINTPMSTTLTGGKANALRYSLVINGAIETEPEEEDPEEDDPEEEDPEEEEPEEPTKTAVVTVNGVSTVYTVGTTVTLTPPSAILGTHGYTNLVCKGWTGSGSIPFSGTGSSITFTVNEASTLNWIYQTNYYFRVTRQSGGTVNYSTIGLTPSGTGYWVPAGRQIVLTASPNAHCRFSGWLNAVLGVVLGKELTYTAVLTQPRFIHACFATDTYTVKFDLGRFGVCTGGSLVQTVAYGQAAKAPGVAVQPGYAFVGWEPSDFATITNDLTVTARYGVLTYPIAYANTLGCDNAKNPTSYAVTNAPIAFQPLENVPTGRTFLGWIPAAIPSGSTGARTVTAQWACDVSVDGSAPRSWAVGSVLSAETPAERILGETNIVCTGWIGTGSVPASGTVNRVAFVLNEPSTLNWLYETNYWVEASATNGTVQLYDAAGTTVANALWARTGTNLVARAAADEGWKFVGWETGDADADDADVSPERAFTVDAPVHLKARFEQLRFTASFDLGEYGARVGGGALTQDVSYAQAAVAPTVEAAPGYAFVGWDVAFDRVVADLTVTARYEVITYAIAYQGLRDCANAANPTNYTVAEAVEFAALTNPPGWRFLGWTPASLAKGTTGDQTVTAAWEHIRYALDLGGVVSDAHYYGDVVTAQEVGENIVGSTNIVCTGWTGTGDVVDGVGTQVTFTVTQPSSLAWRYETNYWVEVAAAQGGDGEAAGGTVTLFDVAGTSLTNGLWALAGTNLTVRAVADDGWQFDGWEDVDETVPSDTPTAVREITVEAAVRLVARFTRRWYVNTIDGRADSVRHGDQIVYEAPIADVTNGIENVVCTGWRGTGDVPATGTEASVSIAVTQPSTLTWLYETNNLGIAFAETERTVARGDTLTITVLGGSRTAACGVQVLLLEQSAKKTTDLDLKNATLDGVTPKGGLKFPLALAWEEGVLSNRVIRIPIKTGKATDVVKYCTFELAQATGLSIGTDRLCTVTLDGVATEAVYVRPIVLEPTVGTVTGGKSVKPNKKGVYTTVTLNATAKKGYWFAGWYDADGVRVGNERAYKVTPDGQTALPTYEARFVAAATNLCGTYNGLARVNLKSMTLVKGADTSADVRGDYAFAASLTTSGKLSGTITVGAKRVSFKGEACLSLDAEKAAYRVELNEKVWFGQVNSETLEIELMADGSLRAFGEPLAGEASPLTGDDVWTVRGYKVLATDKASLARAAPFAGTYLVSLTDEEEGLTSFTLTLSARGKAKVSGKFRDGKSFTSSGTLGAPFDQTDGSTCAPFDFVVVPKSLGSGSCGVSLTLVKPTDDPESEVACSASAQITTYTKTAVTTVRADESK